MAKVNKYLYLTVIQGNYCSHGWEDLSAYESEKDARADLREYQIAEPYAAHRLIKRRELNPDWEG